MSTIQLDEVSLVQWNGESIGHKCGYCKSQSGNISHGMWTETLTVLDYQYLIDRGWRRSGKFCYKPVMDRTCCPHYTIRCEALKFQSSKSQKKVIRKLHKYLVEGGGGQLPTVDNNDISGASSQQCHTIDDNDSLIEMPTVNQPPTPHQHTNKKEKGKNSTIQGPDPNRPPCKKAKLMRLERKSLKNPLLSNTPSSSTPNTNPVTTTNENIESLLALPANAKLKLQLKLVSLEGEDWRRTKNIEYFLYRKYQMAVHDDPAEKLQYKDFQRFLVATPLKYQRINDEYSFGSFHQQYWLNDQLIAVGVLDILPDCVSSVYFFYDPNYRHLTLGTYGSLREVQFTCDLHHVAPSIQYYYMGYYIHSCPKMRYKGKLAPSHLLCPETYHWLPIEKVVSKLDQNQYCRLDPDPNHMDQDVCDSHDLDALKIWVYEISSWMQYKNYRKIQGRKMAPSSSSSSGSNDDEEFTLIGRLIGKKCIANLLFVK